MPPRANGRMLAMGQRDWPGCLKRQIWLTPS
jgi:hypothetical protein